MVRGVAAYLVASLWAAARWHLVGKPAGAAGDNGILMPWHWAWQRTVPALGRCCCYRTTLRRIPNGHSTASRPERRVLKATGQTSIAGVA